VNRQGQYYRHLNRVGWLYVLPATLLFCVFMLYPILSSLYCVTRKWKGFTNTFIGLGNFTRMAHDAIFWQAIGHNFIFMVIQIPIMVFLAMVLAVIRNQGIKRYRGALRIIYFLPCVTSLVAYSVLFRMLLQTNGILNNLLVGADIITKPIGWLSNPFWAKTTIILALTWRWTVPERSQSSSGSPCPCSFPSSCFPRSLRRAERPHLAGRSRQCDDDGGPLHVPAGFCHEFGLRVRNHPVLHDRGDRGVIRVHPGQAPGKERLMAAVRTFSIARVFIWVLLVIGALVCVFPFLWMLVGTTLNPNDVVRGILIPGNEFTNNWAKAVENYNVLLFFFNSLKIALLTVIFGVMVNAFAAFGFEKYRSKARERVFAVLLLTLIIPQITVVIPLYRLMYFLKLSNTHAAIILPSLMSVFIIFFLRQNFKMFTDEIMEAERVDGAGELRIFLRTVSRQ
jgi:ABC-type sugar transport system permease subunit